MASPVFSASAGLSPERAEVAMCKAHINIINPKALHMAASDQLRFRITRFPLAYCGLLHAVNRLATKVFFSGVLFGIPAFMVRSFFSAFTRYWFNIVFSYRAFAVSWIKWLCPFLHSHPFFDIGSDIKFEKFQHIFRTFRNH